MWIKNRKPEESDHGTKRSSLWKRYLIVMLAVLMLVVTGIAYNAARRTGDPVKNLREEEKEPIELFVLAPCESCHEEEKFRQEIADHLAKAGIENQEYTVYNVYKENGASHFEKTVGKYGLGITLTDLPVAVVDGVAYQGSYQEISEAVVNYLETGMAEEDRKTGSGVETDGDMESEQEKDTAFYREVSEIGEEDTTLVLFVTGACESCQKADQYLQGSLSDKSFHLLIYNILDEENAVILRRLMKIYGVPESGQQVPLLFSRSSYLSGAEKIVNGTAGMLESGEAQGSWKDIIEELAGEKESVKISKSRLAVTGFFNGLNPCGISMLLMVLSILLMSKRSFYGGSFTYLAGKFLTYLLLGFTIGTLFGVIENTLFRMVQKGLELFFAVLAFIFGVFYLIDFIHVLKKEYGRTRFQLPERFRKWNHKMINRLTKIPGQFWYPALFLLGIVISAGEFLCTGQVYLASLLYMVEQNAGFNPELAGNLVIYLIAMCVPMVLLTVLVSRGKSVMSASHLSLKILPVIKLVYSIFFFVLFFTLLF